MVKALTTEEFVKKYSLLNKPVDIVGDYLNCKTKIKCKCLICGEYFETTPDSLMQGRIHKPCAMKIFGVKKTSSTEIFSKKLLKINEHIEVIGEYINAITPIKIKCKKCNNIFNMTPNCLLNGQSCPKCRHRSYRKTTNEFKSEIFKLAGDEYELLSEYSTCREKVTMLHRKCGNSFKIIPNNFLWGNRCPYCKKSKGESKIEDYLKKQNIEYISQKTFNGLIGTGNGKLKYDFYLPQYNILVEFQGKQHEYSIDYFGGERQFEIQKEHDKRKREYAKQNNIVLIEINYLDFENIEEILSKELGLIA